MHSRAAYELAAALTTSPAERAYLRLRAAGVSPER